MSYSLSKLLEKESDLFSQIEGFITNMDMEDSEIDALSLKYENCISDIFNYRAKSQSEITDKLDFFFKVIKRDDERVELLTSMQLSLKADIADFTKFDLPS